jgi:transposase
MSPDRIALDDRRGLSEDRGVGGEQTVQVGARGFAALLSWARGLGGERVWALEDCRHVSGSFVRFLIGRGERVLRVTTKLMAASRRNVRDRCKSDNIDAVAVARAALSEGLDALPAAQLEGPELDLRLLVDHRERLIRQRVALNNTLQWHLHDLWPELVLPGSSLFYGRWAPRVALGTVGRTSAMDEQQEPGATLLLPVASEQPWASTA